MSTRDIASGDLAPDDPAAIEMAAFASIDAYTLGDGVRRAGTGGILHGLRPQVGATRFIGRALTARIRHEPHRDIAVRDYGGAALRDRAQPGDVVVLDGGGLPLTAMGALAYAVLSRHKAAAAVVNACVRDLEQMEDMATGLPVFALGAGITSVAGHGYITDIGEPVHIDGIRIATGDLLAGCRGGIVVIPWADRGAVLKVAQAIIESDNLVMQGIERGESMDSLWNKYK